MQNTKLLDYHSARVLGVMQDSHFELYFLCFVSQPCAALSSHRPEDSDRVGALKVVGERLGLEAEALLLSGPYKYGSFPK